MPLTPSRQAIAYRRANRIRGLSGGVGVLVRLVAAAVLAGAITTTWRPALVVRPSTTQGARLPQSIDVVGARLLGWLRDWGADVDERLVPWHDTTKGRGLFAAESIEANCTLVRLPPELCLRAHSREDIPFMAAHFGQDVIDEVLMVAAVLGARDDAGWQEYVSSWPIPATFEAALPMFWDAARLRQASIDFPGLDVQASERQALVSKIASYLHVPEDAAAHAHAVVSTRAVGSDSGWCVLLPGVDIANHNPEHNARIMVAGQPGVREGRAKVTEFGEVWEYGSAGLVTCRAIALGEEVHITYGPLPNQRLLLDYGFTLGTKNPHGDLEANA
mmetsp:Transcript_85693/g.239487  ORF Transcript_85693/g.239487 Transcript_85693/m.239487 type:complete len:332 (+) Transcript_85693:91-1086(+)